MMSSRKNTILAALTLCLFAGCRGNDIPSSGDNPAPPAKFERYVQNQVMYSEILGTSLMYSLFLPASYEEDTQKHYPVVYLLHGYGENNNAWNKSPMSANIKISTLETAGLSEMIYVFPSGFNTYYCNYYTGSYNYMDMFVDELVPFIDNEYRTEGDASHRAIAGYSMGGFGAVALAEKHPELFSCCAALSMSFRTDAQYMAESQDGWNNQWGKIFGGKGCFGQDRLTEYYKQHCPYYQFTETNIEKLSSVKWLFTCGDDEEQLLIANDSLHVLLRDRGFAHEYRVGNGGHSQFFWMDAVSEFLPMFDHYMNGTQNWPSFTDAVCQDIIPDSDGTVRSASYSASGSSTGVYFIYNGLEQDLVTGAMSTIYTTSKTADFIYLPCDIAERSLSEWESYWHDKYAHGKRLCFAFGTAGSELCRNSSDFSQMFFVEADADLSFQPRETDCCYICCTDESLFYKEMNSLYCECKSRGATFEYRVLDGSADNRVDMLRCTAKLKSLIKY